MATFRKLSFLFVLGAQLGEVITSLVWPGVLAWWATPGAGNAMCECTPLVHDTVSRLLQAQLVGALIGALAAVTLGIVLMRMRAKHQAAAPLAAPPSAG